MQKWTDSFPIYWLAQTCFWLGMHLMVGYVQYGLSQGEGRSMWVGVQVVTAPILLLLAILPITVIYYKAKSRWLVGFVVGALCVALFNAFFLTRGFGLTDAESANPYHAAVWVRFNWNGVAS